MLPPGSYRIKIIQYCNPHLIWIDRDNVLEQIGIYGIVPHGKTLAFNPETNSYCFSEFEVDKWLPAAMNLMKEFFADATEIWFSVIHLDDGCIFDGKHKYGDIYCNTKSGLKNLSTYLTKSSFAIIDLGVFHQMLSQKLHTKLNYSDMRDVIRNLNVYYKKNTNKFELYEKDLNMNKGDALEEVNWKFGEKGTDKDFVMKKFCQKMDEKPRNMIMYKKLEMLQIWKRKMEAETKISTAKKDKEPNVKINEEIKNESFNVKPTQKKKFNVLESEKARKMENNSDDFMHDTKYPKRNIKMSKNVIKDDKIDLNTITSSMYRVIDNIVKPVVMVHSKLKKYRNPIFTMRDIPFNEHIQIVLKKMSITRPMSIQSITWHTILRGHSTFIIGPKFCGKTMGYLASVCRLISDGTPEISNCVGPICIIVCATAQSVTQIEEIAKMLLGFKDRILAVYSGVDDMFIATSLLNGCDLLISTPSVLVRLLQDNDFGVDLRRIRIIVLDDCERMNEVYRRELKFCLHKIKEVENSRSNKELKVQFVIASRIWCDFMEPLAKKVPDAVISIGAFPECVIYSKAKMTVSFVKNDKVGSVLEFLDEIDASKKVVIVCRLDDEVKILEKGLKCRQNYIFACHKEMTLSDLYNINSSWKNYDAPLIGPILICTDENLTYLNITDANYLVHYSLPKEYLFFRKRFFVLNDKYPSIFHSNNDSVKIKIILEEVITEELPKILNFVKRCTKDIPPVLDEICSKILAEEDVMKAETLVPICGNLLTLGYCPEFYDCRNRHSVLKGYDDPPKWVPRYGIVTFKIVHLHTAVNYSARLLTHIENSKQIKYPAMHTLSIKLGMYFGNVANRQLHGIPKVGDICAVSVRLDSFARCQVVKIIGRIRGSYLVLIKLLDEEKYEETRDIYLYRLPETLISIETYTVQIRLVNLKPKDNDVTFSPLALNNIKSLVGDEDSYVRGRIVGVIGNCLFLDTLEVCENLTSLDQVVVKDDLKQELLKTHAEEYPDHINKIKELCGPNFSKVPTSVPVKKSKKNKGKGTWAHLNIGEIEGVFITSVINPEQCLVRVSKFEPCMQVLLKDIETYIDSNPEPLIDAEVGDIILAKFPDDDKYERARVEKIKGNMINCFFVDQGDWAYVPLKDAMPIADKLINKLPFQSIECRLIGVKPAGNVWTDFCNTWLSNYADEGTKHFFAKPFNKQPATTTGGNKYSIALVDTSSSADIIINQLMLDLNLASTLEDEIDYLKDVVPNKGTPEDWENLDEPTPDIPNASSMPKLIRSVPLIENDCDSNQSDPWEMYNMADFASYLKQPQNTKQAKQNLPAIMPLADNADESISSDKTSSIDISVANDLDSDDIGPSTKPPCAILDETRQPKLLWRQDRAVVQIKIQLIGVEEYEMAIKDRSIKFSTHLRGTKYAFDFELYGVVDTEKSSHSNKGQYILVKLVKILQKNWGTLGNFDRIKRWIVYDVDNLDASSDEEVVDDSLVNIVKELHEREDTDSDDDVDFIYY
ncbi:putative ATP-dependent RNA helicase TDRD12 [Pieris napi]|uniref:putative ATP-dependent RNA helicase TDRD12 n=1 Tax=Pieris napi TaxID=78633 RepID=UPI001FB99663|nr:putative ATP-dependent RNA helicase TDRD12 [Pieris napi]XP_047524446.1 putative ATP-dependent RNA helicase TDRD12 [Pieris napi]